MEQLESLREKLNALENRLQTLIEGAAAHIFPQADMRQDLALRLRKALQNGYRRGVDGRILAPNVVRISAAPATAQQLREGEGLLLTLQTQLETMAREAGLTFLDAPVIQVVDDPLLPLRQFLVEAGFQGEGMSETWAIDANLSENLDEIPPNAFLIVNGVRIYALEKAVINIGRHPDNDIVLNDPRISRQHAQLRAVNGRYILFDLDSAAGTLVNNQKVHQAVLTPGDVISLAGYPLVYGQDNRQVSATQQLPINPYA